MIAIQIKSLEGKPETKTNPNYINTNVDYVGWSTQFDCPVFINKFLTKEIIYIDNMTNNKEKLPVGNYKAKVSKVSFKKLKKELGDKEVKVIELEVEGQEGYEYISFNVGGKDFTDQVKANAQKSIEFICVTFNIAALEELVEKEVNLVSKETMSPTTSKIYINYSIFPNNNVDWKSKEDGVYSVTGILTKIIEKNGNKTAIVDTKDGKEFVYFNQKNKFAPQQFNNLLKGCELTQKDINKELSIPVEVTITVKNPFVNKSIKKINNYNPEQEALWDEISEELKK